ncbi:hypothetical protein JRI60_06185 [Archangium violaceum]|uniref:hypothetical protein n=1 Tax=Archangium violaceum TaxID=83451 RepID=UPI001950499C|nr:hypothetical protein [Archangium violaceum]QRN98631.1 hypothetical protein JRI60_06185 [Archangium violaceum]
MKQSPSSRPTLLLTLGLLLAPAARAQTDLVALHPCAIVGEKDKNTVQDLQATCATEIARSDVQLVSSDQVRAFLDKDKDAKSSKNPSNSCTHARKPTECLGRLAAATQASRAVLITVIPGQLTRVSGLVVDPKGEVLDQKSIQIRSRGQPQVELVRTAISRLREQLSIVPVKIAPLVEQPPAPAPLATTPPPAQSTPGTAQAETAPAPQPAPPDAIAVKQEGPSLWRNWKRPVAYGAAGAGVVALGLAGYFAIAGNNAMIESNKPYANNQFPAQNELDGIVELRKEASSKRTIAGVSAAVGAALAGAGVYLWLNDRQASATPGTAALSAGPGGVSVHVLLP